MQIGQISVIQFPAECDASGNLGCFTTKGWNPHQLHPAQMFHSWNCDDKKIVVSRQEISFDTLF